MMKCGLPGCRQNAKIRGWCDKHREQIDSGEPVYYAVSKPASETCRIPGCDRPTASKELCRPHYKRSRKGRLQIDMPIGVKTVTVGCKVDGCERAHLAKGYCGTHYNYLMKYGKPTTPNPPRRKVFVCTIPDCAEPHSALGFCVKHYRKATRPAIRSSNSNRRARVKLSDPFERKCSVWAREDMKDEPCWYCGAFIPGGMHVDHAIPLAKGGTENWTNLVHACAPCNLRKNAKTEREFFALLESERLASNT
ncbi:HNH endonuclease [Rhodococcus sp. IEGM 1370]|uniref:HNH endonuclease n=1 Tax=Rhodococcus sp. IEGM 1370 TaxID=3082222 RepID=UPI0039857448